MKCWCKKIKTYTCSSCEKKPAWNRLTKMEKLDLVAYKKKLERDEVDLDLTGKILKRDHCLSMIPNNYKL